VNGFERLSTALRHAPILERVEWLWSAVRPGYDRTLRLLVGGAGIERVINGTDSVRLGVEWRSMAEVYEPAVWRRVMAIVRPGDFVADVGAYVGLYSVALGRRVGETGRVYAFEPDPRNAAALEGHVVLNGLGARVIVVRAAAAAKTGLECFVSRGDSESHMLRPGEARGQASILTVRLDEALADTRLDLLKLDVEGFEEHALRGAEGILRRSRGRPRAIFIEVHPFAWPAVGTSSASLLGFLRECGYEVRNLDGEAVAEVREYGEVVALPMNADSAGEVR
jgi:FkbM family methyltransferase